MSAVIEILIHADWKVLDRKFLYTALNKFNSESGLGDSRMITSGGGRVQNAGIGPMRGVRWCGGIRYWNGCCGDSLLERIRYWCRTEVLFTHRNELLHEPPRPQNASWELASNQHSRRSHQWME